jgi:hypothetical protein
MTMFGDNGFSASFSNNGDFLAHVGLVWSNKTVAQIGTVGADFSYKITGSGSVTAQYTRVGIYGWSCSPSFVEFYIVDDELKGQQLNCNSLGSGSVSKGTYTADGATYTLCTHAQMNQPSYCGTGNFNQFYGIRTGLRSCGHISISEHWAAWASLGESLGQVSEAQVLVEAGGNATGSVDFSVAKVQ